MASEKLPDVIELNVGGILKTTLLSTLTKDPDITLAAMFSGRHVLSKDKEGRFFIDCDGDVFQYILDFLRFGTLPPAEKSMKVYDLAAYFNMQPFLNQLDSFHAVQYRKEIEKAKAAFGEEQYESLKQDAVNGIRKLNISPKEDKVLHIDYTGKNKNYERCHLVQIGSLKARGAGIYTNIFIKTDHQINDDIKRVLSYELCELGFGKYTDTTIMENSGYCQSCNEMHNSCQIIVLFTH